MPAYLFDFSDYKGPYDWSQWHAAAVFGIDSIYVPPEDTWIEQPGSGIFTPPEEERISRSWYDDFLFGYGGRGCTGDARTQYVPRDDDDDDDDRLDYPDAIEVESRVVEPRMELEP
jgi:hypothetical protein